MRIVVGTGLKVVLFIIAPLLTAKMVRIGLDKGHTVATHMNHLLVYFDLKAAEKLSEINEYHLQGMDIVQV